MTILTYSMLSHSSFKMVLYKSNSMYIRENNTMSQIWIHNLICIIQNNFYDLFNTKKLTFNDYMNYSYLPLKCKNHCFFNVPRFTNS